MTIALSTNLTNMPTAHFHDAYAGWIDARVEPFVTTRRGNRVTRYRWITARGGCGFAGSFASPIKAVLAATRRHDFANIRGLGVTAEGDAS